MLAKLISRRGVLQSSLTTALAGIVMGGAGTAAAADKICADPKAMDSGQQSLRTSLNYVEQSPDPTKTCFACGFFQGNADSCGNCVIFNGPANAKGHCDSWGAKG